MAHLILLRNPLTPHEKEEHELGVGETPIEWLQKHHPTGFGMPIRYYVNADEKPLDDLDRMPDADDIVIIALMPGGFLAAMPLLVKVVIGLAVMAAAYFAMQLFAPKQPKQSQQKEIETYNVSSDQNAAKLGEPIPVVYGDVWMTPDYAAQPYTYFAWGESGWNEWFSGVQFLDLILCVGQGAIDVTDLKVGTSSASSLGQDVVYWRPFRPWEHGGKMNVIQAAMGGSFFENVITNAEVENQEFAKVGDESVFYTTCMAGQTGRFFQLDVIFPNGLFYNGGSGGKMIGAQCDFWVVWQEVDADGNRFGPEASRPIKTDAAPDPMGDGKDKAEICNPLRRTWTIDTGRAARWAVKIKRTSKEFPANEGQSTFIWSGLKLIATNQISAYGDTTLVAVRIKASRGIGSDAAVRVQTRCKRIMNILPNGEWAHSTSPADAFYDVYLNQSYGASRPVAELDVQALRDLKYKWNGYQFNYVFRDKTTVWEALKTITVGQAAEPLPQGSFMSIAQDGVKPVRSMLFTDANIVEGSMKINYVFDVNDGADGIEVSYIDPNDWHEVFTRYPANAVIPESASLPGCTSATHAAQYARLVWQRTRNQRKRITFDTELEGIILNLGDRIAVSHEMPKWGDGGLVLDVNGNQITLDHDVDWSGGTRYIMFRKVDGTPSEMFTCTMGAQPNIAVLTNPLTFTPHVDDEYDYTAFAFGVPVNIVRDFTVATTRQSGDTTVTIEAVNYAPEIFDGAMTFLGGAP